MLVEPPRDNPALLNFIRGLKSTSVVSEVNCFSLAEKEKEVVVKAYRIIGVSILVAFLTIGLCYSVAWGVFDKARAVVCFTKGVSYQDKGQWDKAIAEYNKAIEINPSYAEAYYNRGLAYAQGKGQFDKAISDWNKAIELNPSYAEAYNNRGNAYQAKGQYDRAISDYTKAIEINPSYAEAYYNRGVAYGRKGQYDQAISDCNKAIELNPSYAKAYYNRGVAHYFKGEYDKAWEDVHKAESLGYQVELDFLKNLREASGRQE